MLTGAVPANFSEAAAPDPKEIPRVGLKADLVALLCDWLQEYLRMGYCWRRQRIRSCICMAAFRVALVDYLSMWSIDVCPTSRLGCNCLALHRRATREAPGDHVFFSP